MQITPVLQIINQAKVQKRYLSMDAQLTRYRKNNTDKTPCKTNSTFFACVLKKKKNKSTTTCTIRNLFFEPFDDDFPYFFFQQVLLESRTRVNSFSKQTVPRC